MIDVYRYRFKRAIDIGISDMDMSPKAKDLGADFILETFNQGKSHNHDSHTQCSCNGSNANDESGEGLLPLSGQSSGNEETEVQ